MKQRARNLRLVTLNLDYDDLREYREVHKDLSKSIRELIREELDKKKELVCEDKLTINKQPTIDDFIPVSRAKDWSYFLKSRSIDQRKDILVQINQLRKIVLTSGPLK